MKKKRKYSVKLSLYPMKLDETMGIALNPDENKKMKKQSKVTNEYMQGN